MTGHDLTKNGATRLVQGRSAGGSPACPCIPFIHPSSLVEKPCKNEKIQANRGQSWRKMCVSGPFLFAILCPAPTAPVRVSPGKSESRNLATRRLHWERRRPAGVLVRSNQIKPNQTIKYRSAGVSPPKCPKMSRSTRLNLRSNRWAESPYDLIYLINSTIACHIIWCSPEIL